jgi:pyruvate kinase
MDQAGSKRGKAKGFDKAEYQSLIEQLWSLRKGMQEQVSVLAPWLIGVDPSYRASSHNFAHYLALRHADRRPLQESLDRIGVSSLGLAESNVLANLDKVLGILLQLAGEPWKSHCKDEPASIQSSRELLEQHTTALLGPPRSGRAVRIMVTLPSEAAGNYALVRQLTESGMDIARINCAHDGATEWRAMAANVRRASEATGRSTRILMDLGGPKLRTGSIASGPAVLKLRPQRDEFGRMLASAQVGLRPKSMSMPVLGAAAHIGVNANWLAGIKPGDHLDFTDASGAERSLVVVHRDVEGVLVECRRTAYLISTTKLKRRSKGIGRRTTRLHDLPCQERTLHLERGCHLRLTRSIDESLTKKNKKLLQDIPSISCTLPEIFEQVSVGEQIWFDDGRIGGVIRRTERDWLDVEITHARDKGEKLAGDKGINLPDSQLDLPALTEKDCEDLAVVVTLADLVGLSFVQRATDVEILRSHLRELKAPDLGIMLKIETRRSFENLPELLFSAMGNKAAGVMIARGDLAVECGYERLAEVQEEILWAAEAAHMPVIWATQVLETLAKTGLPSRAEITDAAMGERAECVMLNKGPHIKEAMRTLNDILHRMQAHHDKKRPLLRALHAWMSTPVCPLSIDKAA